MGIVVFSDNLSVKSFERYELGNDKVPLIGTVCETPDGGYLVAGYSQRINFAIDMIVLKTDSLGKKEWLKYYGENSGVNEYAFGITKKDDNEYLVHGTKGTRGHITAIDSLGMVKWQWTAPDTGITHSVVRELHYEHETGDFVYMTFNVRPTTYPGETYDVAAPIFVRRDSLLNLKHAEVLGPYAINHFLPGMVSAQDGGWIAAGVTTNTTDEYVSPLASAQAQIVKLTNSGEVVWSVQDTAFFHPVHGSTSLMNGVAESTTGSVYAVGYARTPDAQGLWRDYGWLIKVTSDGCIDTMCTTTSLLDQLERMKTSVTAYPNPATDYLIFDINDTHEYLQIALFDPHGRLLQIQDSRSGTHVVMLNENLKSTGLYVWRVMTEGGRILGSGKFVVGRE